MKPASPLIPYQAIERHGIIGDRRTAALVAADGAVDWLCLPDFDGAVVFGALLDVFRGGYWKLGPKLRVLGHQSYQGQTAVLETRWQLPSGALVLRDAMYDRPNDPNYAQQPRHLLLRTLECVSGKVQCSFALRPGRIFKTDAVRIRRSSSGYSVAAGPEFHVWTNRRAEIANGQIMQEFELRSGQKLSAVLDYGGPRTRWTEARVESAFDETVRQWNSWAANLHYSGARRERVFRAAITTHLMTYRPEGSVVAAPTTSIPERIGGDWNADYRLSWVRDASLCMAFLEILGDWEETERYLKWISGVSKNRLPLQPLYGIHGETKPVAREMTRVYGYRGSQPVRIGNHAFRQFQLGSLGFLTDCVWLYLEENGDWRDEYWDLVRRIGSYVSANWQKPDNSIWELPKRQHYVSTRVMAWVALDRAIRVAERVSPSFDTGNWKRARETIHREVLKKGWSAKLNSFRQRYEADNLDASALLITVMEFLPARDERVLATIQAIEEHLTIDGLVYRFSPPMVPFLSDLPMGEMEGAFLPCTFWLATAYAKAGEIEKAEQILNRVETISGETGLLAEGVDPRTNSFLGNMPLLFSHVEYVRAVLAIEAAKR